MTETTDAPKMCAARYTFGAQWLGAVGSCKHYAMLGSDFCRFHAGPSEFRARADRTAEVVELRPPAPNIECPTCGSQWFTIVAVLAYGDNGPRVTGWSVPPVCSECGAALDSL